MLSQADLKHALAFTSDIGEPMTVNAFARVVVRGLRRLIHCDIASLDELDPVRRRMRHVVDPQSVTAAHPLAAQAVAKHAAEHPLVRYYVQTGDAAPMMISDFLSRRQFHATGLYHDVFQPVAVDDVLNVLIEGGRGGPLVAATVLRSGHSFTERDRTMLKLVGPHLTNAYRAARQREELELHRRIGESSGNGLVVARSDGSIRLASTWAMDQIAECFPDWTARRDRLPRRLAELLQPEKPDRRRARLSEPVAPTAVMLEGISGRVSVEVLLLDDADERLLLVRRRGSALTRTTLANLGLSEREVDVVRRLANGATNAQIAADLGLSVSTVKTHVERISRKLDVHTRTEIAAVSLQAAT